MRIIILIISILLLSPQMGINGIQTEQIDVTISNYSHIPLYPTAGDEITVSVSLSGLKTSLNNVTLIYVINSSSEIRLEMQSISGVQFQATIPGQGEGTIIEYYIELYYDNLLKDRAPNSGFATIKISGVTGRNIVIEPGKPSELGIGKYSVSTPDSTLFLNISVSASIELSLKIKPKNESGVIPNFKQISDQFIIDINNTDAVEEAILIIPYDEVEVKKLSAIESRLDLLTRENGDAEWTIYPSDVDELTNRLIANVTHFSEWTVGSKSAAMRVLDLNFKEQVLVQEREMITIIASNIGNTVAYNVSARLFLPEGLILNNQSEYLRVSELEPLTNLTVTWAFFADKEGTYSIILVLDGENVEDNILELKLGVKRDPEEISSSSKPSSLQSSENMAPYSILSFYTGLMILSMKRSRKGDIKTI